MNTKVSLWFSILAFTTFFVSQFLAFSPANANQELAPGSTPAHAETQTIDTLMGSLEKAKYSPDDIRKTLKPLIAAPFKDVVVAYKKLGTASTIQITFEMLAAKTPLAELTKEGATWATGPLLPDSGRCPVSRDWTWAKPKKSITCNAIAENCESLKTAQIEGEITCFLDQGKKK